MGRASPTNLTELAETEALLPENRTSAACTLVGGTNLHKGLCSCGRDLINCACCPLIKGQMHPTAVRKALVPIAVPEEPDDMSQKMSAAWQRHRVVPLQRKHDAFFFQTEN